MSIWWIIVVTRPNTVTVQLERPSRAADTGHSELEIQVVMRWSRLGTWLSTAVKGINDSLPERVSTDLARAVGGTWGRPGPRGSPHRTQLEHDRREEIMAKQNHVPGPAHSNQTHSIIGRVGQLWSRTRPNSVTFRRWLWPLLPEPASPGGRARGVTWRTCFWNLHSIVYLVYTRYIPVILKLLTYSRYITGIYFYVKAWVSKVSMHVSLA